MCNVYTKAFPSSSSFWYMIHIRFTTIHDYINNMKICLHCFLSYMIASCSFENLSKSLIFRRRLEYFVGPIWMYLLVGCVYVCMWVCAGKTRKTIEFGKCFKMYALCQFLRFVFFIICITSNNSHKLCKIYSSKKIYVHKMHLVTNLVQMFII